MGKTMLCRKLVALLDPSSTEVVSIVNAQLDAIQFPREVCAELGVQCKAKDRQGLMRELKNYLIEQYDRGKKTILFVDDAHQIEDPKTFEELRMLLNLQTDDQFLINIVLAGRSGLLEQLEMFEDLNQMFAVRERLQPLSLVETRELICHRLKTAGYMGDPNIFSSEAMLDLHRHTKGVPRLVCQLADRALLLGKKKRAKMISAEMTHDAANELYGQMLEEAA
jgi:type II secretory pathway predicted ATPase ExeA